VWVVTSQIYWAHGDWVQSSWRRVWVKKGKPKGGNSYGLGQQFYTLSFCAWETSREQRRELGDGSSMEGEL